MRLAAMLLLASIVPMTAAAQERTPTYKGLRVNELPLAYVLDDTGVETKGKLLNLDTGSVVLLIDGSERRFDLTKVRRISRRGDSLKNGAIAGAVIGVVLGSLSAGVADCPGASDGCPGFRVFAVTMGTAFYSAIGVGIDAAVQGRTVLYQAAPAPVSAQNRRAAIGFRVTW